jgi:hypothetical protein
MLGEYAHSCSEQFTFRYPEDIDGMGHLFPLVFYKFCSYCGKDLKEDIKKIWGDYKYQPPKFRNVEIEKKLEKYRIKKNGKSTKHLCKSPQQERKIK